MAETADRVRTLLLRGDNLLKKGKLERAREAFEEALAVAEDPRVRELVERRLKGLAQQKRSTRATTRSTRPTPLSSGTPSGSRGCARRASSSRTMRGARPSGRRLPPTA